MPNKYGCSYLLLSKRLYNVRFFLLFSLFTLRMSTDAESIIKLLQSIDAKILSRVEVNSQAMNEEMKSTSHLEVSIDPEHYRNVNDTLCGSNSKYGDYSKIYIQTLV